MANAHQEICSAIREIVEPHGATVEYKTGKKHSFAVIRLYGTFRKVPMSNGTKNVAHQIDWARQSARRVLREIEGA